MIKVSASNPEKLYLKTFIRLYKSKHSYRTKELLREDSAVLSLNSYSKYFLSFDGKCFRSTFNYSVIGEEISGIAEKEFAHYQRELVYKGRIDKILDYLVRRVESKRAIVDIWRQKYLNIQIEAPCLIYFDLLERDNEIILNWHQRASDAYKVLILDIQIAKAIQVFIAQMRSKNPTRCNLFIDSLHFYKKDVKAIENFYNKINSSKRIP